MPKKTMNLYNDESGGNDMIHKNLEIKIEFPSKKMCGYLSGSEMNEIAVSCLKKLFKSIFASLGAMQVLNNDIIKDLKYLIDDYLMFLLSDDFSNEAFLDNDLEEII